MGDKLSTRDRLKYPTVMKDLERKVKNYFKNNPYPGFSSDFVLDKLEVSPEDGTQAVVRAYLENMNIRIEKPNSEWNKGLAKLGSDYGVKIVLPYEIYRT